MDNHAARVNVAAAAATDARKSWFHPGKTVKATSVKIYPNATSGTHASNYIDIKVYIGSTQIGSTRSTNSSTGSALTQASVETLDISGVSPTTNQISSSAPLTVRTTNAASGVAIDVDYHIAYEEIR